MNENTKILVELLEEKIRRNKMEKGLTEEHDDQDKTFNNNLRNEEDSVIIEDLSVPILLCALDIICGNTYS